MNARFPEPERFVRVQAAYRGRLGVEVGIFVAVDHCRRAGILTPEQEALYRETDAWFQEYLPNPRSTTTATASVR